MNDSGNSDVHHDSHTRARAGTRDVAGGVPAASARADVHVRPRTSVGQSCREQNVDAADGARPADPALTLRLNTLLDTPTPDDWDNPLMLASRQAALEHAATDAAEALIEMLVRLQDERARDVHLTEGGCVMSCTDAVLALHRVLVSYRRCTLRSDGETVSCETITQAHGAGVATLVLRALGELRGLITHEMQTLPSVSS
jgi:hypothetical protein